MKRLLLLYDYFSARRWLLWCITAVATAAMIYCAATLHYKEDISDFLPQDNDYRQSMEVYQQLSEASRIVVIFRGGSPDSLCDAIDVFAELLEQDSTLQTDALQTDADFAGYIARLRFVHSNAPYFLKDADYERLDTLFSEEGMRTALQRSKMILSMPGTGVMQSCITSDPLGIVPLTAGASGQYAAASSAFTSHAGYMMTSDKTMAFAFYDSPYGSTETGRNAGLVRKLQVVCDNVHELYPALQIDLLGAPVVAVSNAQRIKHDSLMAIALSLVLIAAILFYSFPRKRDILLIGAATAFGWLFGMTTLRLFAGQVSLIVLGIGSVIIGIVVNYPLHLLVHQRYTSSVKQTLKEVLSPLIVGNITTVGAFLALVPLHATALRDLGIFAASMLLGTILFCVLILPHLMTNTHTAVREIRLPEWKIRPWTTAALLLLVTLGLGLCAHFSNENLFDSNLSHINYMTEQQRADFAFFEQSVANSDSPAYLASSAQEELRARLTRWNEYMQDYDVDTLCAQLNRIAIEEGFKSNAFAPFVQMLHTDFSVESQEDAILNDLAQLFPGRFDTAAMNSRVAESLSSNFNYLGLICSLIVFVFLWLSFRSFKLAIIAFLPMVVSWVWIFGLMHLFGLHFNIVNIILASFIFGQGDDYTIFVVEGLQYERTTGKALLPQFKQSIYLSALIMLIGIGVLAFAQHPAMQGLGVVTLIGMGCVVILACTLPPLLFKLILKTKRNI